jgi:enediyne biosynthesis protein E3
MFFSSAPLRRLRRSLFGISLEEITFVKRGFYRGGEPRSQQRLEQIAATFVSGYHAALEDDRFEALLPALQNVDTVLQGFAFEGAAMGLSLLDYFSPSQQHLVTFMQGAGKEHIYMLHVGAGWTLGRLPRNPCRLMQQFDPLLRWLVLDGYGFHEGFFAWRRSFVDQILPPRLSGYACRVFDQGLGRSLWFVKGATISEISATIAAFPAERQSDLWSGIGLASAYAGSASSDSLDELQALCSAAGKDRWHLAQGAAFAAKARQRAGNPTAHTELACQTFSGLSQDEAARLSDECLQDLPAGEQNYELWRARLRSRLANYETDTIPNRL